MSQPRYDWWGYVKGMIRRCPLLCATQKELHEVSLSSCLSIASHVNGNHSDPTSNAALRELPAINLREMDAVQHAIADTRTLKNSKERMQMIRMVFWEKSYTVSGAATKLGYSERIVVQWHGDFIRLTAHHFGLL